MLDELTPEVVLIALANLEAPAPGLIDSEKKGAAGAKAHFRQHRQARFFFNEQRTRLRFQFFVPQFREASEENEVRRAVTANAAGIVSASRAPRCVFAGKFEQLWRLGVGCRNEMERWVVTGPGEPRRLERRVKWKQRRG